MRRNERKQNHKQKHHSSLIKKIKKRTKISCGATNDVCFCQAAFPPPPQSSTIYMFYFILNRM